MESSVLKKMQFTLRISHSKYLVPFFAKFITSETISLPEILEYRNTEILSYDESNFCGYVGIMVQN